MLQKKCWDFQYYANIVILDDNTEKYFPLKSIILPDFGRAVLLVYHPTFGEKYSSFQIIFFSVLLFKCTNIYFITSSKFPGLDTLWCYWSHDSFSTNQNPPLLMS